MNSDVGHVMKIFSYLTTIHYFFLSPPRCLGLQDSDVQGLMGANLEWF